MDKNTACCFTGHRIMPNGEFIGKTLYSEIEKLINNGVCDFIAGGAIGFDTLAAKTVLALKKTYPNIRLHLYLPCYDQMSRWNERNRNIGRMIMSEADSKIYVTEGNYTPYCMELRNRKMVNDSKYCIAYCTRAASGTGKTVNFAYRNGNTVVNIADLLLDTEK